MFFLFSVIPLQPRIIRFRCIFCLLDSSKVHSVAWNCTGTKLASGSVDQTARVWLIEPHGHVGSLLPFAILSICLFALHFRLLHAHSMLSLIFNAGLTQRSIPTLIKFEALYVV